MADVGELEFTEAEITRQALVHSSALTYLMVAYARECGQSPEHVAEKGSMSMLPSRSWLIIVATT